MQKIVHVCLMGMGLWLVNACSDNSTISDYDKAISTTPNQIQISFTTPIVEATQGNIYSVKAEDKIIYFDGKSIDAQYVYKDPYTLLINPHTPLLLPNKDYELKVHLKSLGDSLLKDSISLKLHTNITEIDTRLSPIIQDNDTFSLKAQVELSQVIDMKALINTLDSEKPDEKLIAQAISFKDDNSKSIPFRIQSLSNTEFIILSTAQNTQEKPMSYTLTLKAAYFGLEKDRVLHYEYVPSALEIVSITAFSEQKPYIEVQFSQELAENEYIDNFIDISPNLTLKVAHFSNTLRIDAPFSLTQNYTLRIKKGIKAKNKTQLVKDREEIITFEQILPSVAFSQTGVFLPSNAEHKIAFKSINVKNITFKISRIYPNNTTAYFYKQRLIGATKYSSTSYDYDDYDDYYVNTDGIYADFERLGDVVLEQKFALDMRKNEWIQSQLDLSALKDKKGIFILELAFDKDGVDYEFPDGTSTWRKEQFFRKAKIQKHLIFSNIALLGQQINNKLEVFALDIGTNKPMSSVQISAINRKNQAIAQLNTNSQGFASFDNAEDIMYLSAQKNDETTFLQLNAPISVDGFNVSGLEQKGNIQAYIYTDRGVYRPGETAHIHIVARADSKPITHPIHLSIISPQGKTILEDFALKEQTFGLFSYDFSTDSSAPTGIYRMKAKVGGSEFWHNLSVESVIPNRIKVNIKAPKQVRLDELASADIVFKADYLFGAPASGLNFESELSVGVLNFTPQAYKEWTFTHPSSLSYYAYDSIKGTLDDNGEKEVDFSIHEIGDVGKNLRAYIQTKVFENGGRAVNARESIDVMLYDSFVGIKAPENRYIKLDSDISLPVIVLDNQTQKPITNRKLTYRIYHNLYSWWWDYDSYDSFMRSFKNDRNTKLLTKGTLLSAHEPTTLTFKPNQSGEMMIEIEDESNHTKSAIFLYTSADGEPTFSGKSTHLKIQSDKERYQSGEEAKVYFESSADSKALISLIATDRVIERFWLDAKAGQTQFSVPLKATYAPNIYVSVHLLQNYHTLDNDRSQRLYGVIPIMVENADSKLTVNIESPTNIRPNEKFTVKLSNKESKKVAYTLAIVDEGLLDLTDFVSPNPWAYFYQKLALSLLGFDSYDMIIGRDHGKIWQILKVGGDEAMGASRKDLHQAQRFKPVVFHAGPIMSDDKGRASFNYTMPSYMGSVRIMAVGLDDKSYGSAAQNMQVSAPVVMLPTIPRSLKIGDNFTLAIDVLPTQDNVGKVTLNITSGKKIKLDKNTITLDFKNKTAQTIAINAQVSEDSIGQDFIDIALKSGDFAMQDKTEIDIVPNNPYTTLSQKFTLEPKATLNLNNPKNFVLDSENGYVIISKSPIISIDHRLKWLIQYPYGCIEQTTSAVLPQLFISTLSKGDFIDKPSIVKNINAGIARIAGFQTSDGGFAYWQGGTKSDYWGSAYAGHFLLLAKSLGYYVPESVLQKWINYQKRFAKDEPLSAYSLYLLALAGEPQIGLMNNVYESHFEELKNAQKWLLAAAYKLAGLSDMAEKIAQSLPTKSIDYHEDEKYYRYTYGSPLRDDAIILKAYADIYKTPHKQLLSSITEKLESSSWQSTQTLGYALLALSATIPNEHSTDAKQAIRVNFDKGEISGEDSVKIPFSKESATLISQNTFPLYVNHVWDGILLDNDIKEKAQKIAIKRYFVNEKNEPIDVSSLPSASTFYIVITLDNATEKVNVNNIAITQNLPSGWEIENTRLNTSNDAKDANDDSVSYVDIRDDKIMWFIDSYYGRSVNMRVKINTVTPGSYILPPATAEAMYDNSFLANTTALPVKVTTRDKR